MAIKGKVLLTSDPNSIPAAPAGVKCDTGLELEEPPICPTLRNIRRNYYILKPFTQHMADAGIIRTKCVEVLKAPFEAFYSMHERDVSTREALSVIVACSHFTKWQLGVVKRKWLRWEMPRVPRPKYNFSLV